MLHLYAEILHQAGKKLHLGGVKFKGGPKILGGAYTTGL